MNAGAELNELYQTETSVEVKKRILQAMFIGNQSDKLIELAKSEKDAELRKTAIRNLGLMKRAGTSEALVVDLRIGLVARRAEGGRQRALPAEQRQGAASTWRAPRRIWR